MRRLTAALLLALALLLPAPAWAAVAFVAEVDGASIFNNPAVSTSHSFAVNNLIVVVADWDSAQTFTSITSGNGDTFTQVGAEGNGNGTKTRVYRAFSKSATAQQITFTVSGAPAFCMIWVWEISGADGTTPISVNLIGASDVNVQTYSHSVSVPTTGNLVLSITDVSTGTASVQSATTAATLDSSQGSNAASHHAVWGSSGTYTVTWTNTSAGINAQSTLLAVQPVQAAGAATPYRMLLGVGQ